MLRQVREHVSHIRLGRDYHLVRNEAGAATAVTEFDYADAFCRNIGWVAPDEQAVQRRSRVAVGGLGGVHAMTLARLGVAHFHIADFDTFSMAKHEPPGRRVLEHLGQAEVRSDRCHDPGRQSRGRNSRLRRGRERGNVEEFLKGVDIDVDGIDYFAVPARRLVFRVCGEKRIPAVTAAPLGMEAAVLCFMPGKIQSIEEYFRLEGQNEQEQLIRLLIGLSPSVLQRSYLVLFRSAVDLLAKRGPSTPMACEMCTGVLVIQILKSMLKRSKIVTALGACISMPTSTSCRTPGGRAATVTPFSG